MMNNAQAKFDKELEKATAEVDATPEIVPETPVVIVPETPTLGSEIPEVDNVPLEEKNNEVEVKTR